ncbi:MAG: pullulanase, partial [bacterium]
MNKLLILFAFALPGLLIAQPYTDEEKLQGFVHNGDKVIFLFDPSLYDVAPEKVVVTGTFRNWDQDMNDNQWTMAYKDKLWTLEVPNRDYGRIAPGAEFKFRIDNGKWLSPPEGAPNEKGGNLTFLKDFVVPGVKAELRDDHTIWATITGARPLDKKDYRVTMADGTEIPIAGVLPNTSTGTLISTETPMDIRRVYFLEIPSLGLKTNCSYD